MSDEEAARLFMDDRGHYNVSGNQHIAKQVYGRLRSLPAVSRILFSGGRR